ncbi:MAG: shikimate kinase [Bacteroidetes bacterium HGW-Bacteroidetes-6]|jgi:shikimate kinase|nr:MAG: shikimate kinase [Bacteroidetes bacterium HGW-Bacteroidetes-6]
MKVFLIGFMAAGKSRFGKKLANQLGLPFIDLDEFITTETGKSPADWLVEKGENFFREIERACLMQLIGEERFMISTGGGTPCYSDNMQQMNKVGITLWLNTPFGQIFQRLSITKARRPLIDNDAKIPDREQVEFLFNQRLPFYQQAQITIPAADLDKATALLKSRKAD